MKRAIVAAMLFLLPISLATPGMAQNSSRELRELYQLCSRFPFNSRCQGLDIPIPLRERSGTEVDCLFSIGYADQRHNCKIDVTEEGLTVYLEQGEPIELLDNQRPSTELKIPSTQVIGVTVHNFGGDANFAIANITYLANDNPAADNRTNVLNLVTEIGFLDGLTPGLQPDTVRTQLRHEATTATPGAAIQQLRDTNACVRCDLRGANLQGINLDRANLEGANLQGANLQNADLDGAYLIGANFDEANLQGADLEYARLVGATLNGANLTGATLNGANLLYANLQRANLTDTNLRSPIALRNADLSNAILVNADLSGSTLIRTNLTGADLTGANLSDTTVTLETIVPIIGTRDAFTLGRFSIGGRYYQGNFETRLLEVNLKDANLSGADLEDAVLENTDLSGANLTGANLDDVNLSGLNLCGTILPDGSRSQQGCQ